MIIEKWKHRDVWWMWLSLQLLFVHFLALSSPSILFLYLYLSMMICRYYVGQQAYIMITDLGILKQILVKDFDNFSDHTVRCKINQWKLSMASCILYSTTCYYSSVPGKRPWVLKHNSRFWAAWVLTQDQNSMHLYRSCYSGPLKYAYPGVGACLGHYRIIL